MNSATFFLSSGRSGTQWLAKNLTYIYGDLAHIEHEPIFDDYYPRRMLAYQKSKTLPNNQKLQEHIERIERILISQNYIETGWFCFSSIRYLKRHFKQRLNVVHLTRDPIDTCSSMMTHEYYSPTRTSDNINEKALITPFDEGASLSCYQQSWSKFSLFQKCLYLWGEIHSLGIQLESEYKKKFIRVTYEEIFVEKKIDKLLRFLGFPKREIMAEKIDTPFDNFNYKSAKTWDASEIFKLPEVMKIAKKLNYQSTFKKTIVDKNRYNHALPKIQTFGYHIGLPGTNLQDTFDVAVVIPTTLRPSLKRAIQSVFNQDFAGRIQILVGVDKANIKRKALKSIFDHLPSNCIGTIVDLGYSTSIRHGGIRPARDGGSLRTVLSYMANSNYIAYLDDDNWWRKDHLSTLTKSINGFDWSYSLRWYVDPISSKPLCVDKWESTGVNTGVFKKKFGGWVDPNCLLINNKTCESVLQYWTKPLKGDKKGMSADRNIFTALTRHFTHRTTNLPTCFYVINTDDLMNDKRLRWIESANKAK